MKRLPILTKVFLVVFCFSLMLSAQNQGSTINDVLYIPKVAAAPTIDGKVDSVWTFQPVNMLSYSEWDAPDSPADLSAWFKTAWNEDGLYLFVSVLDDSITTAHEFSWRMDNIEIFIDGGNKDSTTYQSTDVQWRAMALVDTLALCWNATNLRPPYYTLAWTETSGGYDMELAIPDSGLEHSDYPGVPLFNLQAGEIIGFDLQVADDDSVGSAEASRWYCITGAPYSDPSLLGTAELGGNSEPMLQIPNISTALTIDADESDWPSVESFPRVAMSVVADGLFPDSGTPDLSGYFRAAWNDAGDFYLFGRVLDDSIDYDHANDWQRDGFEVYFDGNNSKETSYDEYDDVQYRFVFGDDSATQGPSSSECSVAWNADTIGYTFELLLPAATLADTNINLSLDDIIGFEVQVQDNDGVDREGIVKWWTPDNNTYLDPSLLGTAILQDFTGKVSEPVANNIALSVPAVISSNNLVVSCTVPAGVEAKVSLFNIAGQIVKTTVANGNTASLDVSGLANGVYLCNLKAGSVSATKKVLLIK